MKLVIAITKGIIRDQHARRQTMFVILIGALVMLFLGATFLSGWLAARPWLFIGYWAACAWLTVAALLLALLDMLLLRAALRRERRRLKQEILRTAAEHADQDD